MEEYCIYCGASLIGAKRFCVKCGREQKETMKKAAKETKPAREEKKVPEGAECFRCGEITERVCFFCKKPICVNHKNKMQANVLPSVEFKTAMSLGDRKRINQGWRGRIVDTCSRCSSINEGRPLNDDELSDMRTVDKCSWFELSPRTHKY